MTDTRGQKAEVGGQTWLEVGRALMRCEKVSVGVKVQVQYAIGCLVSGRGAYEGVALEWLIAACAWENRFALMPEVHVERLAVPPMWSLASPEVRVDFVKKQWVVSLDRSTPRGAFDRVAFARLPGAIVPAGRLPFGPAQAENMTNAARQFGWKLTEQAEAAIEHARNQARELREASRAVSGDLVVDGIGAELRPYQRAGVEYLVRVKRAFLGDDMGLGKTAQALCAVHALGAFPLIVVTLAVCKPGWEEEVKRWLPGARPVLWSGEKPGEGFSGPVEPVCDEPVVHVINYDLVPSRLEELQAIGAKAVVLDESQRIKNRKTKRAQAVLALGKRKPVKFCLSGTPAEKTPSELITQLQFLGRLNDVGGFALFTQRFCAAQTGKHGMNLQGPKVGTRAWREWQGVLRNELSPALRSCCLLRRERQDVLKELPPKVVTRVPLAMSEQGRVRYESASKDIVGWLAEKAGTNAAWETTVAHLEPEAREGMRAERIAAAVEKLDGMELLLRLGTLRQAAGEAKLAAAKEWVEAFLENGRKLALFAHHRPLVQGLAAQFHAPVIAGGVSDAQRRTARDRFMRDPNCRLIVLSLTSGGTGLDGLQRAGADVAFLEEPWTPAALDQAVARLWRMGQENVVHEWHLHARGTVDEELWERLANTRETLSSAMGDSDRQSVAMDIGRAVARALGARRF